MKLEVRVKIGNDDLTFGKGVVLLLEGIERHGSLTEAYKEIGMSSSKAWKILHRAKNDLGFDLIETMTGGKDGGRSCLTHEGKQFLEKYKVMNHLMQQACQDIFSSMFQEEENKKL